MLRWESVSYHRYRQLQKQLHKRAEPFVFMIATDRSDGGIRKLRRNFDKFTLFQFLHCCKLGKIGNSYIAFYQLLDGLDTPKLNYMIIRIDFWRRYCSKSCRKIQFGSFMTKGIENFWFGVIKSENCFFTAGEANSAVLYVRIGVVSRLASTPPHELKSSSKFCKRSMESSTFSTYGIRCCPQRRLRWFPL